MSNKTKHYNNLCCTFFSVYILISNKKNNLNKIIINVNFKWTYIFLKNIIMKILMLLLTQTNLLIRGSFKNDLKFQVKHKSNLCFF